MGILYLREHLLCLNYDNTKKSFIQKIVLKRGQKWDFTAIGNKVLFIIEGSLRYSFADYSENIISKGQMLSLPANYVFSSSAAEDTVIIFIRLTSQTKLCDCFPLENLLIEKNDDFEVDNSLLEIKAEIWEFLRCVENYLDNGLKCYYLLEMKGKEFFYLLRAFYPKVELLHFFYLILTNDNSFSDFIFANYHKAKTVQELADLANYSLSGFQKRFKRVFGVSVYHWMQEKRSKNILHEIHSSEKSLKEISNDYGFSSPSHFNDFCKGRFGATPGKIRKEGSLLRASEALQNE